MTNPHGLLALSGRSAVAICLLAVSLTTGTRALAAQRQHTEHTLTSDGAPPPTASLDQLAWLAGHWRGTGLGGDVEEFWTVGAAGSMVGVFKLVVGGVVQLYEIAWITETGAGLTMRLKHFSGDLTGWESKEATVDFPLVQIDSNAVHFDGLTYRLTSDRKLEVFVAIQRSGTVEEARFDYQRVPATPRLLPGR